MSAEKEEYMSWKPLPDIPREMYAETIVDDFEGFRILLRSFEEKEGVLRLSFDEHRAYRNIDEGDRLLTCDECEFVGDGPLFMVRNSKWINWFCEQTLGITSPDELIHYSIITPNDWVDVLSHSEPAVEWLT